MTIVHTRVNPCGFNRFLHTFRFLTIASIGRFSRERGEQYFDRLGLLDALAWRSLRVY
jgi:hypothetical protein